MVKTLKVELKSTREVFSQLFSWLLKKEEENNLLISALLFEIKKLRVIDNELHSTWILISDSENLPLQIIYKSREGTILIGGDKVSGISKALDLLSLSEHPIESVMGPENLVEVFFEQLLNRIKPLRIRTETQILYTLKLNQIKKVNTCGRLINPKYEDLVLLTEWYQNFSLETGASMDDIETSKQILRYGIDYKRLFVWKDDSLKSMALLSGESPNGCRISMVYTPNEYRRLGYSYYLLNELAQLILEQKKKNFCVLFANEKDEASNKLYKKIGFIKICSFQNKQIILA